MTELSAVMSRLDELVIATKASIIPFGERYIDADGIALMLHFKPRYVLEVLTKRPGFPAPLRVDGTGHPRWKVAEISAWAETQRAP